MLDNVAAVTQPDTRRFNEAHELYKQHVQLRVPQTLLSWMSGKEPMQVNLADVSEPISTRNDDVRLDARGEGNGSAGAPGRGDRGGATARPARRREA
jgi:hypothetical protein